MKIAMIAAPYVKLPPEKYGGTERVIYYLVKGLVEKGHEVTLFAPGDSDVPCELVPIVDKHTFFPKNKEEEKEINKKVDKAHAIIKRVLNKRIEEFDIVHGHFAWMKDFDMKYFQDYPNLVTLHGPFRFSQINYFKKRKGLFFASISENQQEGFPDLQYVGVCYNGLDPDEFPFVEKPEDYLCFIGRFDDEKNPHLAIELALSLNMKIKLAGKLEIQGAEYFEKMVKPYLENPLVEYLGEINMEQKIELVGHAKASLHPASFRESFGLTVLEAAYLGTPTLAIKKGSVPELIEDGRTGLLVEDFVEGYHHMDELFNMDRKYISQRSRSLFNYKTMTTQYELAYQKVVEIFNERKSLSEKTLKEMQTMREILKGVWKKPTE